MLDSILDIDKFEIVEVRRILCSGTTCFAGLALLVRLGFEAQNVKQLDRIRVKRRVEVAGFRCFSSVLIRGSFGLISTPGGAYWAGVGPSILGPDSKNCIDEVETRR
jgi:hypothetical protein